VSKTVPSSGAGTYAALLALAFAIAAPPFFGSYFHYLGILALINAIAAIGLNLLTGNAGQISVCNSSFMAIGAYTATYVYTKAGLTYWLALPSGAFVAALFGFALGFPALRLRGFYLAVVTLGFLEFTQVLVEQLPSVTGGVRGISAPRPTAFGWGFTSDLSFYYLVLAITLAAIWFARSILKSPTGRAFNAIRSNEAVAQTLAVPLAKTKLTAFVLSAFYAGFAGGLYASAIGFIDPLEFGLGTSIRHVVFVVVGGLGSVAGSVIGAVSLTLLPEFLRRFQEYNDFVFGGILLITLMIMPRGIVSLWPLLESRLHVRRANAPAASIEKALS
jgi:branched-chain amino acid transport system permease protein